MLTTAMVVVRLNGWRVWRLQGSAAAHIGYPGASVLMRLASGGAVAGEPRLRALAEAQALDAQALQVDTLIRSVLTDEQRAVVEAEWGTFSPPVPALLARRLCMSASTFVRRRAGALERLAGALAVTGSG